MSPLTELPGGGWSGGCDACGYYFASKHKATAEREQRSHRCPPSDQLAPISWGDEPDLVPIGVDDLRVHPNRIKPVTDETIDDMLREELDEEGGGVNGLTLDFALVSLLVELRNRRAADQERIESGWPVRWIMGALDEPTKAALLKAMSGPLLLLPEPVEVWVVWEFSHELHSIWATGAEADAYIDASGNRDLEVQRWSFGDPDANPPDPHPSCAPLREDPQP